MDNIKAGVILLECGLFLRANKDARPKHITKFNMLENRLVVQREETQSLYNEIYLFHQELGLKNGIQDSQ